MGVSDVVSVHAPLSDETRHLIGAKALAAAKPRPHRGQHGARRRGRSRRALSTRCATGRSAAPALDVLEKEPADPEHPLIKAFVAREPWLEGRFTLSPHAAFYSPAAQFDLRYKTAEVGDHLSREGRLINCVNEEILRTPLR